MDDHDAINGTLMELVGLTRGVHEAARRVAIGALTAMGSMFVAGLTAAVIWMVGMLR